MAIYLLYVVSPVIVYLVMGLMNSKSINKNDRRKKTYMIICGIIMALMIGLRNKNVGSSDTQFYYRNWELMAALPLSELPEQLISVDIEFGYQITVWILAHIFPWGQWVLILSGIFFAYTVCTFSYRNSKNVVISLVVFNSLGLFNFMVQGLRQAIAMCICLWALEQCKNKRLTKFVLLIILACSFHASAVVFSVAYFLGNFNLKPKSLIAFLAVAFIGIQFLPIIFDIVNYIMNDHYDLTSASASGGDIAILIYVVIVLFGLLYKDTSDKHYALFMYATMVAVMAMVLRNSTSAIAERVSYYYFFGQMVVLPNSIVSMRDKRMQVLVNSVAVLLCFGVSVYKASYSVLIPYTFFWQS